MEHATIAIRIAFFFSPAAVLFMVRALFFFFQQNALLYHQLRGMRSHVDDARRS
jgi:hypothetical protein